MRTLMTLVLLLAGALMSASGADAYAPRQDVMWARTTTSNITLDGVLDEPAWALAESVVVNYGVNAGIPGSGWKVEAGFNPTDPTNATFKFLVKDNVLYMAARMKDKSIGGSTLFNRFDGLLMAIKDRADAYAPKPPVEYFYSWWHDPSMDPQPAGQLPIFRGRYGAIAPPDTTRSPASIQAWDARTVVNGTSNSDAGTDVEWVVEMRFDLTVIGYNTTRPEGDVIEWNVSVYDCDCFWPLAQNCAGGANFASNRVWFQSPWGNDHWYDEVRIFARPDVNTTSGPVPAVPPEFYIPEIGSTAPVIDGVLSEPIYQNVLSRFDIRYGDAALRNTYPGVGPYRAGQYQPPINGGEAAVLDPGDATVSMFVKGDWLYMGFDVRDQAVQYHPDLNRWDGFTVTMTHRDTTNSDRALLDRRVSFQVAQNGTALPQDYLVNLIANGKAQVAVSLKASTNVDTLADLPGNADIGYTAELAVDLKAFGYPAGLGDRIIFLGITLMDGDSFSNYTDSYGTRTWWFREFDGQCCPVWAHIIPIGTSGIPDAGAETAGFRLIGPFPNPSAAPNIRFALPRPSDVTLQLFDVSGRLLLGMNAGRLETGEQGLDLPPNELSDGLYLYRLTFRDPGSGAVTATLPGRLMLMK